MVKCGGCGRFLKPIEGVRCCDTKCGEAYYHRACVGFSSKAIVTPDWRCPECKKNIARDNKAETPVRAACSQFDLDCTQNEAYTPGSPESKTHQASPNIRPEHQAIMDELKAVRADLTCFRRYVEDELAALRGTVLNYNERVEGLEERMKNLEQRTFDSVKVDSIVDELRQQLNDRDQELLANDIEINNLPESTESPVHMYSYGYWSEARCHGGGEGHCQRRASW